LQNASGLPWKSARTLPRRSGLAFLQQGKMFCGIEKDELMVRVGPERYEEPLQEAPVRPMDFTGRP
jgi:hypothetical protein